LISSASFSLHRHSESKSSGPLCSIILLHGGDFGISLSDERKFDAFRLGELDERLLARSNDENVGETGSESAAIGILDVDDLVGTGVLLEMHESTDTTNIVTSGNEADSSILEFNNSINLVSLKVQLDRVVLLDIWVGIADGSAVVGHNIRNFVFAKHLSLDSAKFESSFLSIDSDRLETTLHVVENAEVLSSLGEGNDIHAAEWEPWIATNFVVNLDIAILVSADFDALLAGEGVLQSIAEQDCHRDALSQLMGSCRWARCVHTLQFVQTPVTWCPHALHMLLWSSCL